MDDLRENVITLLDEMRMFADLKVHEIVSPDNWNVYSELCDFIDLTKENVLGLLKAQEPRVITLAELWHMEHKPVYLERKNSRLYMTEPSIVLKTERSYIPSLGQSYILMRENKIHDKYWECDYNKTWRCWTSRPTDEQREAVKWE